MAERLSKEQREFVVGCVKNYLDTKECKAHKAAEMAKWASVAWFKAHGTRIRVTPNIISGCVNTLRDRGGIHIIRDPDGNGYRCVIGYRNQTPALGDIIRSQQHEKKIIASTIKNQVLRPMMTIHQTVVINSEAKDALTLLTALNSQDNILTDAIGAVKQLATRRYHLIPESTTQPQTAKGA